MLSPEQAIEELTGKMGRELENKSPSGCCHFFVSLNDDWGIKFSTYSTYKGDDRYKMLEDTRDRQLVGLGAGIAPKVGKMVSMEIPGQGEGALTRTYSGYITEKVETSGHHWDEESLEFQDDCPDFAEIYNDQKEELEATITRLGWSTGDVKIGNCGVRDGQLLFIDFGSESL